MGKKSIIRRILFWLSISILTLLSVSVVLLIFKTDIFVREFQPLIESIMQNTLELDVGIEHIEGNIIRGFKITNVKVNQSDDLLFKANVLQIDLKIVPLIYGKFITHNLSIHDAETSVPVLQNLIKLKENSILTSNISPFLELRNVNIQNLNINFGGENVILSANFNIVFDGTLISEIDEISIEYENNEHSFNNGNLKLENNILQLSNTVYSANNLISNIDEFEYDVKSSNLHSLIAQIDDYSLTEPKINFSNVNVIIKKNNYKIKTYVDLNENYEQFETEGIFDTITLNKSSSIFDSSVKGKITHTASDNFKYDSLSVYYTIDNELNNLQHLNINEININENEIAVNGSIHLSENNIFVKDSLKFNYNMIKGSIYDCKISNLDNFQLKGFVETNNYSIFKNEILPVNIVSNGRTNFDLYNTDGELVVRADLNYREGEISKIKYNSLFANLIIKNNQSNHEIELKSTINDITFNDIKLDTLKWDIWSETENYFTSIHGFNSNKDYISIHGQLLDNQVLVDNYFADINSVTIAGDEMKINLVDGMLDLNNTKLQFGNGTLSLSGEYHNNSKYKFHGNMKDINISDLAIITGNSQRFDALCGGDIYLSNWDKYPMALMDLDCSNGQFDDITFNEMSSQFTYQNNRLLLSDFKMYTELGDVNLHGWATNSLKDGFTHNDSLSISGKFNNFDLLSLNRYLPWQQETGGKLSGDFIISGPVVNPNVNMNVIINDPKFDKITGENVTGALVYTNERLYLKGLHLVTQNGEYSGVGSLPVDLRIVAEDVKNIYDNQIDFMFTGISSKFEFLPPYIQNLDSLTGDYSIQLNLTGTFRNPVREGQIVVQNGAIYLLQLDNPITDLKGIAKISENKLVIDQFEARLNEQEKKQNFIKETIENIKQLFTSETNKNSKTNNISITGAMDLTSFFQPDYLLHFNGENIFVNSSYGQFYGRGNAEFWMTGKDTVKISGKFKPKAHDFTLYGFPEGDDFAVENLYNKQFFEYDISFPLENEVKIVTDNLDILVDGDLNISSLGGEEFKYSGKINIIDGKFEVNGNIFQDTEGSLYLNPGNKAPFVDVHANIFLIDEDVNMSFVGPINNPNIILETTSEKYSQSDILQMIAFNATTDENENISLNVGDIVSNYIENEIEKNITQYGILDEFKVQSSSGSLISSQDSSNINLYFGKQISNNLYLNTRLNVSESLKNEYEIAYRLNKNMSVVARLDEKQNWHFNYRFKYHY